MKKNILILVLVSLFAASAVFISCSGSKTDVKPSQTSTEKPADKETDAPQLNIKPGTSKDAGC